MSILLDIIIVSILVLFLFIGKKNGFVKTTIDLLGWLVIIIVGSQFANLLAGGIFDLFIKGSIVSSINNTLENAGTDQFAAGVTDFFNDLPGIISGALASYDVTSESITATFFNNDTEVIAEQVVSMLKPPIVALISLILTVIIFIVGIFLVKILSKICGKLVSKLPIVSGLDKTLGAVIGLLKGFAISLIFVWVLATVVAMTTNGLFGITSDLIDKTYIFKFLNNLNPIL